MEYLRVSREGRPFEPTNLSATLRNVLAGMDDTIRDRGAVVTCDPLPAVTADPEQMAQLFQNLIGNAIQFCDERFPLVHVGVERRGRLHVFFVRDNGIGIDPEYFHRLFLIFQGPERGAGQPDPGIGLAVCKSIVDRHAGRLWLESAPGKGSTFYFTIPVRG